MSAVSSRPCDTGGVELFLANSSWHIAISTLQLLSGEILMVIREIA